MKKQTAFPATFPATLLALFLCLASNAMAQSPGDPTLYAVTMHDLIIIDPDDPYSTAIVGHHSLPITTNSTARWGATRVWGAGTLAYHKELNWLLGIHFVANGPTVDQYLVQYDLTTGGATTLASVGNSDVEGLVESLEYVDHLNTLVMSQTKPATTGSVRFYSLDLNGTRLLLSQNGRDNDWSAYDPCLETYYTMDHGILATVDLTNGDTTNIGEIHNLAVSMTWGSDAGKIFFTERVGGTLWSIDTAGGVGPITSTMHGIINAPLPQGLAFIEETCYADCDRSTGCGVLDVFDFLCFQEAFVKNDPYACECEYSGTVCDIFDFLCFQNAFVAGCP